MRHRTLGKEVFSPQIKQNVNLCEIIGVKDIFTECSKEDDKAMKHRLAAGVSDRLVNLESFNDKTLDEHYGGASGNEVTSSSSSDSKYVFNYVVV